MHSKIILKFKQNYIRKKTNHYLVHIFKSIGQFCAFIQNKTKIKQETKNNTNTYVRLFQKKVLYIKQFCLN